MKTIIRLSVCALILMTASVTRGQPVQTYSALGQNAALQYWPAFNFLPHNQADLDKLADWRKLPLDDKPQMLIGSLRYLHAGAQIKQCDWGIDMSQGPYTLLPFLNRSRPLTYQACLHVRFDVSKKHWADAADHGSDALVAARHVTNPPVAVSLLVCFADERDAIDALALGLHSFDRDSLARLTARLDALPPAPTLGDSLKLESRMTVDWAVRKIKNAGPNPNWHEILGFLELDEGRTANKALDQYIKEAGGTPDAVASKIQALLPFYDEAQKLDSAHLTQSEFNRQAQELLNKYAANPFAKPILPQLAGIHDAVIAAQTRMTLLRAAIAVLQNGPEAAKQFTDPSDHQPFNYQARHDGFELTSKVVFRNQPLTLTIGGAK